MPRPREVHLDPSFPGVLPSENPKVGKHRCHFHLSGDRGWEHPCPRLPPGRHSQEDAKEMEKEWGKANQGYPKVSAHI